MPVDRLRAAVAAGLTTLGENRVQEAADKVPALPGATWHLIGPLQSNKARRAVELFDVIQSVDSVELGVAAGPASPARSGRARRCRSCSRSTSTTIRPRPASRGRTCRRPSTRWPACQSLELRGLMTIGRLVAEPEQARTTFRRLRGRRPRSCGPAATPIGPGPVDGDERRLPDRGGGGGDDRPRRPGAVRGAARPRPRSRPRARSRRAVTFLLDVRPVPGDRGVGAGPGPGRPVLGGPDAAGAGWRPTSSASRNRSWRPIRRVLPIERDDGLVRVPGPVPAQRPHPIALSRGRERGPVPGPPHAASRPRRDRRGGGRRPAGSGSSAPPVDGAANAALVRLLASELDVPKGSVRIVSGESSRSKVIAVDDVDRASIVARWPGLRV